MPNKTGLQKTAISGFIWVLAQQFGVQMINFIVLIILAKILLPEVFGLLAMLQIFISISQSLIDSGMTSSLIRTVNPDQKDYSTVFFSNFGFSIIIYLFIYFLAPYISQFYGQEDLTLILRVYSITFIVQSFVLVQSTRLTKFFNFKLQTLIQVPSVIIGGIIGIVLAKLGFGVWSLVWMNLIRTTIWAIQLWLFSKWKPSFVFSKEKFLSHFKFGYKLTFSGVIDVIYQNLYIIIIGRYFSATQLGLYNQSYQLSFFPTKQLSAALDKVSYPLFSNIQDDNVRLKIVYKRIMEQVLFWIAPFMCMLAIYANPLFLVLMNEKWLPAVPYFQILCLAAITYPLHKYNLNILNVKGRSDLFFRLEVIKKILGVLLIIFALPFEILGLVISQFFYLYLSVYINSLYSGKMIDFSLKDQLISILPIILNVFACSILSYLFNMFLAFYLTNNLIILIVGFLIFIINYLLFSYIFKISAFFDFKNICFTYLKKNK